MMKDGIRNKVWDISLVVEEIKKFPQTYDTILGELCGDGTCQTILRRKLNKLYKQGVIYKSTIPGTRFGKAIFYIEPKDYFILVESTRTGSVVYVFFKYHKTSRYYIKFDDYYVLRDNMWEHVEAEKTIFHGNTLKFI